MYCPKCKAKTKVIDSRAMNNQNGIRRRRKCLVCGHKFTTYEELENSENIEELRALRIKHRRTILNLAIVEDILKKEQDDALLP